MNSGNKCITDFLSLFVRCFQRDLCRPYFCCSLVILQKICSRAFLLVECLKYISDAFEVKIKVNLIIIDDQYHSVLWSTNMIQLHRKPCFVTFLSSNGSHPMPNRIVQVLQVRLRCYAGLRSKDGQDTLLSCIGHLDWKLASSTTNLAQLDLYLDIDSPSFISFVWAVLSRTSKHSRWICSWALKLWECRGSQWFVESIRGSLFLGKEGSFRAALQRCTPSTRHRLISCIFMLSRLLQELCTIVSRRTLKEWRKKLEINKIVNKQVNTK